MIDPIYLSSPILVLTMIIFWVGKHAMAREEINCHYYRKRNSIKSCKDALAAAIEPFSKQPLVFTCLHYTSLKNTVGIGEIARNEKLELLFPLCFLPLQRTFRHLHQI